MYGPDIESLYTKSVVFELHIHVQCRYDEEERRRKKERKKGRKKERKEERKKVDKHNRYF